VSRFHGAAARSSGHGWLSAMSGGDAGKEQKFTGQAHSYKGNASKRLRKAKPGMRHRRPGR